MSMADIHLRPGTSAAVGSSGGGAMRSPHVTIKQEPGLMPTECYAGHPGGGGGGPKIGPMKVHLPPSCGPNRLFNGIAGAKRNFAPGDWLAPNTSVNGSNLGTSSSAATASSSTSTCAPTVASNGASSPLMAAVDITKNLPPTSMDGVRHHVSSVTYADQPTDYSTTNNASNSIYEQYNRSVKMSREELSPDGQSAYMSPSCYDLVKKKKSNGSGSSCSVRQQEELCLVCGDRASGYHYNALTCEGCKGFFRRSITKNAVYRCKYGETCDIDMYMRRKCQECRLKKCLGVGMRPECVVPEYQCAVKRKEKKAQRDKDRPNSTTNGSSEVKVIANNPNEPEPMNLSEDVKPITPEQEELIHSLVFYQEQYEQPPDEELQRVMEDVRNLNEESDVKFRQITEMTILTVQLIVEFAKSLPGFDKLLREDQITLLKACSSEVMMLRMARKYDIHTDSIVFANNEPYTKDSYNIAGMGETIEDLLRFCRQMYTMKVDNAEYALLTAVVIFSGRPCLTEGWKVEKIQEIYIETLKSYVDNRVRPNSTTIFARLLSVLTELRTLGNQNSETCFTLKLKSRVLPPFLSEIWDISP